MRLTGEVKVPIIIKATIRSSSLSATVHRKLFGTVKHPTRILGKITIPVAIKAILKEVKLYGALSFGVITTGADRSVALMQVQYDALVFKDPSIYYFIMG